MAIWAFLSVVAAEASFPEQTPGLIEACLNEAVASKEVSKTEDSHKYICDGLPAQKFWTYLENANVQSYEQEADNAVWSTREFPLGGCFKKVRNADGSAATSGLSCTVWIPYRAEKNR